MIEINDQFKEAIDHINARKSVFITGKAGTGKSTFLKYFIANTTLKYIVLAPTGVAAVNIGGQTIHSFFKIFPGETMSDLEEIIKRNKKIDLLNSIELIIIDEVSMLRADLFDLVDQLLRKILKNNSPFAGKQLLLIGDLYQLPPVVTSKEKEIFNQFYDTPYFFSSNVAKEIELKIIEFDKIYRQTDEKFIEILNKIRNGTIEEIDLDFINQNCLTEIEESDFSIYITPYNETAKKINEEKLSNLKGKKYHFEGIIEGDFPSEYLPTERDLILKNGSQVMMLVNNPEEGYVNGTIGKFVGLFENKLKIETEDKDIIYVSPFEWTIFDYEYNKIDGTISKKEIGSFYQYPVKLAWAITIHKSQGKTFKKLILDIGKGAFSPGQIYVALSRCTSLEGLKLKKPLLRKQVFIDRRIITFMTSSRYIEAEKENPLKEKQKLIEKAIEERKNIEIVYLKKNDQKSQRIITPIEVGVMEYAGKKYTGLSGFCHTSGEERNFRLDRILDIKIIG
ncbi:MAG: AAA family ATPase [Brevinematales bacterium]|nr:AAA family ATPase [Brevinematales bacterium]